MTTRELVVRNAASQLKEAWREWAGPPAGNETISYIDPLAESELRYRRLFESAQDGILILDAETGQITDANPFLEVMLGYRHSELLGKTLWEIGALKDVVASREAFRQLQTMDYVRYDNLPLETREHEPRHVEFVSNVYKVDGTRVIQCNIRDITARKLADDTSRKVNGDLLSLVAELQKHEGEMVLLREKLHDQANHDPLTGLFNRRYLDDSLSRDLSLSWRRSAPLCLVALDIDHFKSFNDSFGHEAGDRALRECARVLSRNLRKCDIACRLGGDEFAIVMPDSSLANTRQRLEEICALITRLEIRQNGKLLGEMTMSAGIAVSPEHAFTAPDLLRAADVALYSAKQAGRGKIFQYEPSVGASPPE